MDRIIDRFRELFVIGPNVSSTVDVDSEEADNALREQRFALIRDARTATSTEFFKEYRRRLDSQIDSLSPDPMQGSDVAICMTFKREGLMLARNVLNLMVKLAEERIPNE